MSRESYEANQYDVIFERQRARIEALELEVKTLRDHIEALNQFGKKRRSDLEAEIARLKAALQPIADGFPSDVAPAFEKLAAQGVEWGSVAAKPDADHVTDFADSLAITRAHYELGETQLELHGVYIKGTEFVFCHTGTSPNSATHARIIAGLIESTPRIVESARAALTNQTEKGE